MTWLETSIVSGSFSGQRGAGHASLLPDDLSGVRRQVSESSGHLARPPTDRTSAKTADGQLRRVGQEGVRNPPLNPSKP